MFRIRIVGHISESLIISLKEYLIKIGITELIQIVDFETTECDIFEIKIIENFGKWTFICEKLDICNEFELEKLKYLILSSFGFKMIKLTGLTIKDGNNVKTKPIIEIFSNNSVDGTLPDSIEYTKQTFQKHGLKTVKQRIYFESDILVSLLPNLKLTFIQGTQFFELFYSNQEYFMLFTISNIPVSLDFILDRTAYENMLKHMKIATKYPVFNGFVEGKIENLVFNNKFYKKIKENKNDIGDLLDFLEHVPKFQDQRDEIVEDLKHTVYLNYPNELVNKYQYLDVYKAKIPKNKNSNSIKKYFNIS